MDDRFHFAPLRRQGLIFQAGFALIILAIGVWGIRQASRSEFGFLFLLYLIPPIIAALLLPLIAYRTYSLWRAYYTLERNGLHIHWGVRVEDIPIQSILWVRHAKDPQLASIGRLPLPVIRWPGAVRGVRKLSNGFPIEYMAADTQDLVLIATEKRIIAISPTNSDKFLYVFQRLSELGSLSPWQARSIYPTFILARVWNTPSARNLILAALLLDLILLGWVSIIIPTKQEIFLGFTSSSEPLEPYRMLLLPLINSIFLVVDTLIGIFFFRMEEYPVEGGSNPDTQPVVRRQRTTVNSRTLAFISWGAGIFTPIIFLVAAFFITVIS